MCFSANASFGAGIVISVMAVATIRKVTSRSQLAFAGFPVIFLIQQFAEGFVWLCLTGVHCGGWQSIPIYIFLVCSHVIWPVLIPFSMLLLEDDISRKRVLSGLLTAGLLLSTYHLGLLFLYPVITRIDQHHIQYIIRHGQELRIPANILYGTAAIAPFFVSGVKRMWFGGIFLLAAYLVSYLFFRFYVVSVWCYFATIICFLVYLLLSGMKENAPRQKAGEVISPKG